MTIGYVTIGAQDVEAATGFFDAVLKPLGYNRGPVAGRWAFYGAPGMASIGVCTPDDGQPARGGNGMMVGLKAPSRAVVHTAYEAALANGGTDGGPPGPRPLEGAPSVYAGYFRDPVGNKFCVFVPIDVA